MQGLISENAAELRRLQDEINRTFRERPHGPAHHAACDAFHDNYDRLAFPGGLSNGLTRLRAFEPQAVEIAVRFIEADPWFFRSGYIKEEIIRRLKHAPLDEEQRARLRPVVLKSILVGDNGMARPLATLAPAIVSASLRTEIEHAAESPDRAIQRRAEHVLHVLRSAHK